MTVPCRCRQPIHVAVDRARGVPERREIPSVGTAPCSGVRVHERRENALDRGQHLLGVNDPFVGGLRPLDGSMDAPHHGHDRDDGEYCRSAKCA